MVRINFIYCFSMFWVRSITSSKVATWTPLVSTTEWFHNRINNSQVTWNTKLVTYIDYIFDLIHKNESIFPETIIWPITMIFPWFFWTDVIAQGYWVQSAISREPFLLDKEKISFIYFLDSLLPLPVCCVCVVGQPVDCHDGWHIHQDCWDQERVDETGIQILVLYYFRVLW